jgi:hypothetical protein
MCIDGFDDRPPCGVVLGDGNESTVTEVEQNYEIVAHEARVTIGDGPFEIREDRLS